MSSQNLVGATLSNVGVAPVSQSVAQDGIDLVEQGQIGGGAQTRCDLSWCYIRLMPQELAPK